MKQINQQLIVKWSWIIFFAVLGVYQLWLLATSKINYYTHPRTNWLALLAGVGMVVIAVCIVVLILLRKQHLHWHASIVGQISLITLAISIMALPVVPLQSTSVNQRKAEINSYLDSSLEINSLSFINDNSNYSLGDWLKILNDPSNFDQLAGQELSLTGFIYRDTTMAEHNFMLARFQITCCAVDATPIGLHIKADNWWQQFKQDQWVKVTAKFEPADKQIQLIATKIEAIDTPNDPYFY